MSPKVHSIKRWKTKKERKKEKEKKPARLKTQKGGLGKSWGQRKEKKRILQDESLEVWFKMNEHKNKSWYKWPMKTSEKMTKKKWDNSSNTWFFSNAYLGETS